MSVNEVCPGYSPRTVEIQLQQRFSSAANKTVSLSPVVVSAASVENVMVPSLKPGVTQKSDVRNDEFLQKMKSVHVKLFSPSSELLAKLVATVTSLISTGSFLVSKMSECNEKQAQVIFKHRISSAGNSCIMQLVGTTLSLGAGGISVTLLGKGVSKKQVAENSKQLLPNKTRELEESEARVRALEVVPENEQSEARQTRESALSDARNACADRKSELSDVNKQIVQDLADAERKEGWGHFWRGTSSAMLPLVSALPFSQLESASADLGEKGYQSGTAILEHATRQSEDIKALLQHILQILSQVNARTNDACGNFRA